MGCQGTKSSDNLPPEPPNVGKALVSSGNLAGQAFTIPEGYAPPTDVFNDDIDILTTDPSVIDVLLGEEVFPIGITASQDGGYIYKKGYYYNIDIGWTLFDFDGEVVAGSNWIRDSAFVEIELNKNNMKNGENYVVAYSCKKYSGEWKCGCKTVDGPCNMWMLQQFIVNIEQPEELPPEPEFVPGNQTKPGCGLLDNKCKLICPSNYTCINVSTTTGCGGFCQPITGCGSPSVCTTKCPTGYYCSGAFPGGCGGTCVQTQVNKTGCGLAGAGCAQSCSAGYNCTNIGNNGCGGTCVQTQVNKTGCGLAGAGCAQSCSAGYTCYNTTANGCGGTCY